MFNIIRTLLSARSRGLPFRPYLACAVVNILLGTLSARQIQHYSPSTKKAYEEWVRRKVAAAQKVKEPEVLSRLKCDVEPLDDGKSSLLWLGNRQKAKKVVLFFHGGGYIAPMMTGHVEWCWQAYITAGIETGVETAVAVLQYSLAPGGRYPTQLRQAANGLSHILSAGFGPRDIVIGGDSAGGNLAAALLCHLVQPQPTVDPVELEEPLAAAFLVSPWVTGRTSDASFTENSRVDMISAWTITKAGRDLLGGNNNLAGDAGQGVPTNISFPLDVEPSYFEGLSTAVRQIYVTAGNHEVFRDQVVAYVDKVRRLSAGIEVRFDLQKTTAHDFIFIEGHHKQIGECTTAMRDWMKNLLSADQGQ